MYVACERPARSLPPSLTSAAPQAPARHSSSYAAGAISAEAPAPAPAAVAAANPAQLLQQIQLSTSANALYSTLRASKRAHVDSVHLVAAVLQLSTVLKETLAARGSRQWVKPLLRYITELATPLVPQYQFQDISTSLHALRQVRRMHSGRGERTWGQLPTVSHVSRQSGSQADGQPGRRAVLMGAPPARRRVSRGVVCLPSGSQSPEV
jgi:hypothetical protein